MKRLVTYFPQGNLNPVENWETEVTEEEIIELKEIASKYPNGRVFTNKKGNLCINYGRYQNEFIKEG